jgi:hypothetical protein
MCHIFIWLSDVSLNSWLLTGEVTAATAAGWGIICETMEGGLTFRKVAQRLIIWGVVLETCFTVALFVSEEINTRIANETAANAIERAADANRKAEEERLARVKIEDRLNRSVRSNNPADWIAAIDKLKIFSGQKINLIAYPDDREIDTLAHVVESTLTSAGWSVFRPTGGKYNLPIFNVSVEVQVNLPNNHHIEAADALIKWFQDNRMPVGGPMGVWPGKTEAGDLQINPEATVNVVIGKRP